MQMYKTKILVSLTILIVGLSTTIVTFSHTHPTDNSGIIIDFGKRNTIYTYIHDQDQFDPISTLEYACENNGYDYTIDNDTVTSINFLDNGPCYRWGLYITELGSKNWVYISNNIRSLDIRNYSAVCWGYCNSGDQPTRAVDETGKCFYGNAIPQRIVSLAPSCTEIICFVGGINSIVGTDAYSNYPSDIIEGHYNGSISIVGGYINSNFEEVIKQSPELVVCIGDQNSNALAADKLRNIGINVLVMSKGESINTVLDNIFMAGVQIGVENNSNDLIRLLESQMENINSILNTDSNTQNKRIMVTLSNTRSPWVSGYDTYLSDVMKYIGASNVYCDERGWTQVNSETIVESDPEYIIIISMNNCATRSDYDLILDSTSLEWRSTTAYKNGNIYILTGEACDIASRPGPRVAQVVELMSRVLYGNSFTDNIIIPKFVGDNYKEYLVFTQGCYT